MKVPLTAKVEEATLADLERYAEETGLTRSQLAAWAIEHGLAELRERLVAIREAGLDTVPGVPPKVAT